MFSHTAGPLLTDVHSGAGHPDSGAVQDAESVGFLVLLHQKFFRRGCLVIGAEQHGHRGSVLTSAAIKRRRIVAIEFGMWRSGRSGGTAGSITFG